MIRDENRRKVSEEPAWICLGCGTENWFYRLKTGQGKLVCRKCGNNTFREREGKLIVETKPINRGGNVICK